MHKEDQDGFITIENNPISKCGVFDYLGSQISSDLIPDKIYKVWRPEEELNNQETIDSFKLIAWIPKHVMLGDDFTAAEQVGIQGVTGEDVYFKDGTLFAKLKLLGKDLKNRIKNGLKELSCGFRCTWDIASGITPDGKQYDVIQRNIRGNHLASVQEGRMGHDVRVALDSSIINQIGEEMEIKELIDSLNDVVETFKGIAQDMKDAKEEKEKAEDAKEEEKSEDAKDEESAEDSKKENAEDAEVKKALDKLEKMEEKVNSIASMDESAILKSLSDRNDLATKATNLIGEFDYSSMTQVDVAKYALEKMGVACDSGLEVGMLKGILTAQKPKTFITETGQDSSISKAIPELSKLGL